MLPSCQDTGTAIVKGKKGELVLTGGGDREAIARGIFHTYDEDNLRYSQMAPLTMYEEKNTGTNLPAEIEIEAVDGDAYKFLFMAKGGGSANKSLLFQETKALLNPSSLMTWLDEKLRTLGTAACPPYHLALVIGGTSAEMTLKTAKLASARYLDSLPDDGQRARAAAFATSSSKREVLEAHAAVRHRRAVRRQVLLPRRARDPPAAARRVVPGRAGGVVLGRPPGARQDHRRRRVPRAARDRPGASTCPRSTHDELSQRRRADRPQRSRWREIRATLSRYPVKTRVMLNGPMVVARDIAHAKIKERLDARRGHAAVPDATTACTTRARPRRPTGYASGSFGPTTAGRMDSVRRPVPGATAARS